MLRVPMTQAATRLMLASKKSRPMSHAVEHPAAHQLAGDGLRLVVEDDHVVAVPADGAAHVQEHPVDEGQHRRQLVGDDLGGVEVAGVEAEHDLPAHRVGQVELVRAGGVALGADPEELALHGVAVVLARHGPGEGLVERLQQALPRPEAVVGQVLGAVRDPEVEHRRRPQGAAEGGGHLAAGLHVADPEGAHAGVGVGEGPSLRERVREAGGVEVEPDLLGPRPLHPAGEVLRAELVARHRLARTRGRRRAG